MLPSRLADSVVAVAIVAVIIQVEQVVHELAHLALNVSVTGEIARCGDVGPIMILERGRLGVCYAEAVLGPWNAFLVPPVMSALGILLMVTSPRWSWRPLRWGTLAAGTYVWLIEALYSMGFLVPPTLVEGGVRYRGDGIESLEAFGAVAWIPGALLIGAGLAVLSSRVAYQRQ